jgi:hypothetical protein
MLAGIGVKLSKMRSAERGLHRLIMIIVSKSLLDVLFKGPVIPSTARDLFVKRYISRIRPVEIPRRYAPRNDRRGRFGMTGGTPRNDRGVASAFLRDDLP